MPFMFKILTPVGKERHKKIMKSVVMMGKTWSYNGLYTKQQIENISLFPKSVRLRKE